MACLTIMHHACKTLYTHLTGDYKSVSNPCVSTVLAMTKGKITETRKCTMQP